jgi:hypothetical protein
MMKISPGNETYRTPVELMGYTAYATNEGARIPWPVIHHFLQGIQDTKEYLEAHNEEMRRWHNQIPDGEDRVENIRRMHEDASQPIELIAFVNNAAARAEACAPGRERKEAEDVGDVAPTAPGGFLAANASLHCRSLGLVDNIHFNGRSSHR